MPPLRIAVPPPTGLDIVLEEPQSARSPTSPRRTSEPNFGDWGTQRSPTGAISASPGEAEGSRGRSLYAVDVGDQASTQSPHDPPHKAAISTHHPDSSDHHLHSHTRRHSPPPRLQDRLPDEDEVDDTLEEDDFEREQADEDSRRGGIPSDPRDRIPWDKQLQRTESGERDTSRRDTAILGFDRLRLGMSM